MNELPDGWSYVALAEVAEVTLGQSPPGSSYNEDGEGTPFFQGKAEFGEMYPEIAKWTTEPKKFASAGDILLSIRAPVGPTNVAPLDCSIGRGLHAIRPMDTIDRDYLLWGIRSTVHVLASQATGSTFEAVSGKQVKEHRLALAPLAEQERIVAGIEELFTRLDVIEPALEGLLERLGVLRSAILADAFHANRDLPDGWEEVRLKDVADTQLGKMLSKASKLGIGSRPYLRNQNVQWDRIDLGDVAEMDFTDDEFEKFALRPGDLLVTEGGEVGRAAIWKGEIDDCAFQKALHRVRPLDGLQADYFLHLFRCWATSRFFDPFVTGTTIKHLPQEKLRSLLVPLPPLPEQRRIVEYIEAAFSRVDALEAAVQGLLERVKVFRQSVLTEAFAGRLVPQDPADEPASVLLERIRADRELAGTKRGKVKA